MSILPTAISSTPRSIEKIHELLTPLTQPPPGNNAAPENHCGWLSIFCQLVLIESHEVPFYNAHDSHHAEHSIMGFIASMVEHGFGLNKLFENQGVTPLGIAAGTNCRIIASSLLSLGADINAGPQTPLWLAALKSHYTMVDLLTLRGANISTPSLMQGGFNELPIHVASNPNIIRLLADRGANIHSVSTHPIRTSALHWAVRCANTEAVETLFELGCTDARNQQNETALDVALKIRDKIYPLDTLTTDHDNVTKRKMNDIIRMLEKNKKSCPL